MAEVIASEELNKLIFDELDTLGRSMKLSGLERPKAIYLTADPFSIENEILTPTMKLKRNVGRKVYQEQLDQMYAKLAEKGL